MKWRKDESTIRTNINAIKYFKYRFFRIDRVEKDNDGKDTLYGGGGNDILAGMGDDDYLNGQGVWKQCIFIEQCLVMNL